MTGIVEPDRDMGDGQSNGRRTVPCHTPYRGYRLDAVVHDAVAAVLADMIEQRPQRTGLVTFRITKRVCDDLWDHWPQILAAEARREWGLQMGRLPEWRGRLEWWAAGRLPREIVMCAVKRMVVETQRPDDADFLDVPVGELMLRWGKRGSERR